MISNILTVFKADTSEMKSALKGLKADQKELQQAELEAANARNKQLEDWIGKLGKATIALGAVAGAVKLGVEGLRSFGTQLRLETAAGAVNVDKLSDAFDGLVPRMDLLKFAAQSQRGELGKLKLGHADMQKALESVGKAATALTRAGFDQDEVMRKLSQSVIKLKDEGLDDLGLKFEQGATQAETFKNMMAEMNRAAEANKGLMSSAADDVQRLGNMWDNAKNKALGYVGATLSIKHGLDEGHGLLFDFANVGSLGQVGRAFENKKTRAANATGAARDAAMSQIQSQEDAFGNLIVPEPKAPEYDIAFGSVELVKVEKASKSAYEQAAKLRAELEAMGVLRSARIGDSPDGYRARSQDWWMVGTAADTAIRDEFGRAQDEGLLARRASQEVIFDAEKAARDEADRLQGLANMREEQNIGQLEKIFGPVEQFEMYELAFAHLGATFSAFSDAVGSGYEAIVTGQAGIAEAFKKTLASGLLSIGKSSVVEALRQTALGFGALALGPVGGVTAGMHFKSAAMHGAVAVAAGLAANAMGAGGGGASAAAAASGGGSGDGRTIGQRAIGERTDSKPGKETYIVAYLDPFANQPEHVRKQMAREYIANVTGNGVVTNS